MEFKHKPVLLQECIDGLDIKQNGIYVDGTLGGAGHSSKIVEALSSEGMLIGIDRDEEALEASKIKLKNYNNVRYMHGNHDDIKNILTEIGINKVDGILLDLGVSSYQLDEKSRGFSYMGNGKLDMRMDKTQSLTAEEVINSYSEEQLTRILLEYGEEKFASKIAKKICLERIKQPIQTTMQLVNIIEQVIPNSKKNNGHPAKRTFQAIRIEVNNEIEPLYKTVLQAIECLKPQGRLCIITFHSLEDKAVKKAFVEAQGKCTCPPDLPYCVCNVNSKGRILTKKPILPSMEEINENSRSKSAKLRIFERN